MSPKHILIAGGVVLIGFLFVSMRQRRHLGSAAFNTRPRLRAASTALAVLWLVAYFALNSVLNPSSPALVVAAVVAVAMLGLASIWILFVWLKTADELIGKIEIEAASIAFLFSIIGLFAAQQLKMAGIIPQPDLWDTMGLMFVTYALARSALVLRYR